MLTERQNHTISDGQTESSIPPLKLRFAGGIKKSILQGGIKKVRFAGGIKMVFHLSDSHMIRISIKDHDKSKFTQRQKKIYYLYMYY